MGFFDIFKKRDKEPDQQPTAEERQTLEAGLEKTKQGIFSKLTRAIAGRSTIDDEVLDELEDILITSDVGVDTTLEIIDRVKARVAKDKYVKASELQNLLRDEISTMLCEDRTTGPDNDQTEQSGPYVMMVVGVNGAGKTTSIGKLAAQFKAMGLSVVLGAADTFRAAAVDQLEVWAQRAGVPIIKQQMGTDPAAVAYEAVQRAVAMNADVVIIDTAGRLHNKVGLMNELSKIKRTMQKVLPTAPNEVMLVLDGSTGQNAFEQAKQFSKATDVDSLVITKLDGTAKGGAVIGISHLLQVPVRYIGLGEGINDLQRFDRRSFVESIFGDKTLKA